MNRAINSKLQDNTSLLNLNKITLNFSDKKIEQKFRLEYFKKSIYTFRLSFITLTILYSAFGYLDYTTAEKFYSEFFIVRYFIVFPLLISVFLLSFYKFFVNVWQKLMSLCFVVGGAGIIYMLLRNPDNIFYYGGMFLIFMAGYFFIKLRFFWALIPGLFLIILYNLGTFLMKALYDIEYNYLLITNAFYISANIIGALALYYIERLERVDFYQKILLSEKQEEIALINQNLELEVAERTKLLDDRNKELIAEVKYRKEIEKQHFYAKEKAEESDRLKSAFLANMSHEIRTPMNGILGFANLLKKPKLKGEKQQEYIDIIKNSGARLLNIINDLIDISKVESGQMELSFSETNISEQLKYIYAFFKPEVESKGMNLFLENSPTLSDTIINTDREKIYAILTNLVKNAVKYSEKGHINIGFEKENGYLKFYVQDTGIGIKQDSHQYVFERFRQGTELLTRNYEGAGLGLSISKAYVEMLGGKIWLESEVGKGSNFYFTIPYSNEVNIKSLDKEEKSNYQLNNRKNNLNILIAEDDATSEQLISDVLENIAKNIVKVGNGVDAVETIRNHSGFDLILMDIKMPEMDGYEATRQIRKFNKDVIIIAQTAFGLTNDKQKALEAGCNAYISKPIQQDELLEIIGEYL